VVTQEAAGLAQKGGATWSHVQIADQQDAICTTKVGMGEADLVIACDPIVASHAATTMVMRSGRTRIALNTHHTPTAALMKDPGWQFPSGHCDHVLGDAVGGSAIKRLDSVALATKLLGDAIYANPLMMGFAWQMGWIPLSLASLTRAIELNAVQVARNLAAFEWGRWAAHDPVMVARLSMPAQPVMWEGRPLRAGKESLDTLVKRRVDYLASYQNSAYAQRYADFVQRVRQAETPLKSSRLSEAVARHLFKLMAYKDEYEVARLLTSSAFKAQVAEQFEGDWKMVWHLSPPMQHGAEANGHKPSDRPAKHRFGPMWGWVLKAMSFGKVLRGTPVDPMGWTRDRREDRAVLAEYEAMLDRILPKLSAANLDAACRIAELADQIKGYGPVRHANVAAVRPRWMAGMAEHFAD
jgi:indolepyruvate ferredoxin oxidoreductase